MISSLRDDFQIVSLYGFKEFLFENDFKAILPEVRPVCKRAVSFGDN